MGLFKPAKPAWQNSDPVKRREAYRQLTINDLRNINNLTTLMEIINAWDEQYIPPEIILGIVELLPPEMLLKVFVKSYKKSGDYKDTSISGIRQICSLKKFNEREKYLSHLISRLSTNKGLLIRLVTEYAPFFINSNEEEFKDKVCKEVFNIISQETINTVALETKCPDFIKHCNDDSILERLAQDEETRWLVIARLGNSKLLAQIALTDSDWQRRGMAINKIEDQSILEQIALKDSNEFNRSAAVRKMTSPTILASIAQNDKDVYVRLTAAQNIHMVDQVLIMDLVANYYVKTNNNRKGRDDELLNLIKKLVDSSTLVHIIENENDYSEDVRYKTARIVLEKTSDPELREKMYGIIAGIETDRQQREERADWALESAKWNR